MYNIVDVSTLKSDEITLFGSIFVVADNVESLMNKSILLIKYKIIYKT